LGALFPVKDLGPLHYSLGLKVQRSSTGLFLSQAKYATNLLTKVQMTSAKPCASPVGSAKLDHNSDLLPNPAKYRSIVGTLQYLTWTRPDLSYVVNQIGQVALMIDDLLEVIAYF
ncbi:uncharacterized protein LOC110748646, partial [Prunus avium]